MIQRAQIVLDDGNGTRTWSDDEGWYVIEGFTPKGERVEKWYRQYSQAEAAYNRLKRPSLGISWLLRGWLMLRAWGQTRLSAFRGWQKRIKREQLEATVSVQLKRVFR